MTSSYKKRHRHYGEPATDLLRRRFRRALATGNLYAAQQLVAHMRPEIDYSDVLNNTASIPSSTRLELLKLVAVRAGHFPYHTSSSAGFDAMTDDDQLAFLTYIATPHWLSHLPPVKPAVQMRLLEQLMSTARDDHEYRLTWAENIEPILNHAPQFLSRLVNMPSMVIQMGWQSFCNSADTGSCDKYAAMLETVALPRPGFGDVISLLIRNRDYRPLLSIVDASVPLQPYFLRWMWPEEMAFSPKLRELIKDERLTALLMSHQDILLTCEPKTRRAIMEAILELTISRWFALIIAVTDGYLVPARRASANCRQLFAVLSGLPLDLQRAMAGRLAGAPDRGPKSLSNVVVHWALGTE